MHFKVIQITGLKVLEHCVCAFTHHSDGSEGKQVVVLLTVAPRIPTRILALLQDVHLTAEVHLLKAHKTAEGT